MKEHMASTTTAASAGRRRWRGPAGVVLALVFCSLLVPLVFLLGLHNRFPYVYLSDERSVSRQDSEFGSFGGEGSNTEQNPPKDVGKDTVDSDIATTEDENSLNIKDIPSSQTDRSELFPPPDTKKGKSGDDLEKPCQLEYGSYCRWFVEHKVEMIDSVVSKLKDQLFVARAYYPSVVKQKSQGKFSREVRQNIQDHERILSEAVVDADLPPDIAKKIRRMEQTIAKARLLKVDCNNVDKKLRQILDLTEDEAHFHMRQSAFLYHLGVHTMPKNLHCLLMRLTVEYFRDPSISMEVPHAQKFDNMTFHHYVIFSRNILASSVTINSTVVNAKDSGKLIFHVITDGQNYFAMKLWFSRISYKEAAIQVLNLEDLGLNYSYKAGSWHPSFSEEFRIALRNIDLNSSAQFRMEYISVFGHAQFLLPDVFKNLKKVVVLDDDVVVQQDLSPLWNLKLDGKVNAAIHFCNVQLGQLKHYIGGNSYNKESCAWMSGLNIIDLEKWREHGVTAAFQRLLQEVQTDSQTSWRAAVLPSSYLAFQDLTYPLDDSWVLSGLGNQYGLHHDKIRKAPVLHYNGNMKPWLDLGIRRYKKYWKKFLTRDNLFMDQCNVNP